MLHLLQITFCLIINDLTVIRPTLHEHHSIVTSSHGDRTRVLNFSTSMILSGACMVLPSPWELWVGVGVLLLLITNLPVGEWWTFDCNTSRQNAMIQSLDRGNSFDRDPRGKTCHPRPHRMNNVVITSFISAALLPLKALSVPQTQRCGCGDLPLPKHEIILIFLCRRSQFEDMSTPCVITGGLN